MPVRDFLLVCLIAGACGLAVAALGALLLRRGRGRTLSAELACTAAVGVATMAAGTAGVARAMFISAHDLTVMMVVCAVSAVLAVVVAVLLSRRVVAEVDMLRKAAHRLGDEPPERPDPASEPRTAELAELRAEIERTAGRLADARARNRAAEEARRELIAWISHDLRAPLAGLRAMAEALEDDVADDPARYHRLLRLETERLSAMVDDLFELSRIQAGALRLRTARVSLFDLIGDALAGTEALALARGVTIDGRAVAPVPVIADAREMARALTNLLVNAIRHTPGDGTVVVAVDHAPTAGAAGGDGAVVVAVTDQCGGIPEQDLPRVFDTGWRGTHARTPGDGGAGLGLAIVRGIVEAHRGTVTVTNAGAGCRFEVCLPRA